jgi:hypothetical protein
MKYISSWKISPGTMNAAIKRFLETGGAPPEGIKMLGRWHGMNGQGFAISEATERVRSGRLNAASGYGHLPLGPARIVQCSGHPCRHYISTSRPTSTTWAGGTPKYAAGRLALRCIMANRDFLQTAMPDVSLLGITITRLK